jgi:hypothetical protein
MRDRGRRRRGSVACGHTESLAACQKITDDKVAIALIDATRARFPELRSISMDKGFHSKANQAHLANVVARRHLAGARCRSRTATTTASCLSPKSSSVDAPPGDWSALETALMRAVRITRTATEAINPSMDKIASLHAA